MIPRNGQIPTSWRLPKKKPSLPFETILSTATKSIVEQRINGEIYAQSRLLNALSSPLYRQAIMWHPSNETQADKENVKQKKKRAPSLRNRKIPEPISTL